MSALSLSLSLSLCARACLRACVNPCSHVVGRLVQAKNPRRSSYMKMWPKTSRNWYTFYISSMFLMDSPSTCKPPSISS
ncbi:hypothetical protein RHMOL_Rhmol02G0199600 [Rhododendron molle]|uniref:Uncharacterized protein n=1 Tax=Rhododendron molle TaxID=49168 RepID=A0ACC0PTW6_RHOML|nr:hypothetical protein RHMOL_Rhmol02G0199600 [Rhododendron molle]